MRITELLSTTRARVSLATALIVAIAAAIVGAYVIRGDRAESPGATSPPPAMEMNGQAPLTGLRIDQPLNRISRVVKAVPEPAWPRRVLTDPRRPLRAASLRCVTPAEKVLNPGPIPYARIDLYGDPDLEHALREEGLDPRATSYRLIEIPVSSIRDTASMPWPRMGTAYVDAIRAGQEFPPIVVSRGQHGWSLLDGVNRTHAHWVLGTVSIRAYELLIS